MRVLILGGTGVISTGITRQLLDRGDQVTLFNRGKADNPFQGEAEQVIGSRQSASDLDALAGQGFDAVIDMICYTEEDTALAISAFRGLVPHYLFCSTVDVYSAPAKVYPITEEHPREPSPKFPYAHQKARSENLFLSAEREGAFALTILRPAATYARGIVAPIGTTALYLDLLRRGRPLIMHGDGSALWVATHRDDVARGFVGALDNPDARGRAYNLCSTEFLTWDRYWQVAAEAIGAPPPHFVHIPTEILVRAVPDMAEWCDVNFQYNNVLSNEAARRDLGFTHTIPWREGAKALRDLTTLPDPVLLQRYDSLLASWANTVLIFGDRTI